MKRAKASLQHSLHSVWDTEETGVRLPDLLEAERLFEEWQHLVQFRQIGRGAFVQYGDSVFGVGYRCRFIEAKERLLAHEPASVNHN